MSNEEREITGDYKIKDQRNVRLFLAILLTKIIELYYFNKNSCVAAWLHFCAHSGTVGCVTHAQCVIKLVHACRNYKSFLDKLRLSK